MSPLLNTRARLARAARNNVKIHSLSETVKRSRVFITILVVLLPIYPSLSFIGRDATAHGADYDDSTIITAYSDIGSDPNSHIGDSGLVTLDIDSSSKQELAQEEAQKQEQQMAAKETEKRAPVIMQYTVVAGDTLAKLSEKYDVSIDAISWANDIRKNDILKPGSVLKIPPISGVIHHVARGDTLSEIADKYDVDIDDIIKVNRLTNVASLRVGAELVIPGAVRKTEVERPVKIEKPQVIAQAPIPVPTKTPTKAPVTVSPKSGLKDSYSVEYTGKGRGFAGGNCTWYVAQYKNVSWRGNANQWIRNARAAGAKTGDTPVPGSIIQLSGRGYNRYYGHVGIVADVTDDYVIIKDMNYRALYEVTIRKIPIDDPTIDGYIYVD